MSAKRATKAVAYGRYQPASRAKLREFLDAYHATSDGFWLVRFKAGHGPQLSYEEVCEELVRVGWVDSKPASLDAKRSMLLCTPRKPKSAWSAHNKRRVAALTKAGQMHPSGLAAVKAAKANGTWSALDAVERLEVPEDLATRLKALAPAARHFEAFPRSVKRQLLEWVASAKKAETRAVRVEEIATKAQQNVRANQWRDGKKS